MKYFRDEEGVVYAFESDGSQDEYIPEHLISMTCDEYLAYQKSLTKEDPKKSIAAKRYAVEISGISIHELNIDTGRDSQSLITGAALQGMIDPSYTCKWKTVDGFVELTSAQLLSI